MGSSEALNGEEHRSPVGTSKKKAASEEAAFGWKRLLTQKVYFSPN